MKRRSEVKYVEGEVLQAIAKAQRRVMIPDLLGWCVVVRCVEQKPKFCLDFAANLGRGGPLWLCDTNRVQALCLFEMIRSRPTIRSSIGY